MIELKKTVLKTGLLILLMVVLNYVYKYSYYKRDVVNYADFDKDLWLAQEADILYFGDCSDSYFGEGAKCQKGISELLDSLLPDKNVIGISEPGFHAGVFCSLLESIPNDSGDKTIIITMNLRSFSALTINSFYDNYTNQRLVMLNKDRPPLLNRFLIGFEIPFLTVNKQLSKDEILTNMEYNWRNDPILPDSPIANRTIYEWVTAIEKKNARLTDSIAIAKMEKKIGYVRNYGFTIDSLSNPRIHDFDAIVSIANKRRWKLVFNLLPENISEAELLGGRELSQLIEYNRNLLINRYKREKVCVLDNIDLLEGKDYIEDNPNSHYYYQGRKKIAENIAGFLHDN